MTITCDNPNMHEGFPCAHPPMTPEALDEAQCIEYGSHRSSRRHTRSECPMTERAEVMYIITGTHYTQADRWSRDYFADEQAALATEDPLMYLHALGYDVSQARVTRPGR